MKVAKGIMVAGFYGAAFFALAWFFVSWVNVVSNNDAGGAIAAWNAFKILF